MNKTADRYFDMAYEYHVAALTLYYRASLKTPVAHTHVTNLCYNKGNQAKEQKRWETEGFLTKIFDLQS